MTGGTAARCPLALGRLAVGVVAAVLGARISLAAVRQAARRRHLAHGDAARRAAGDCLLFGPLGTAGRSLLLHGAGRSSDELFLEED